MKAIASFTKIFGLNILRSPRLFCKNLVIKYLQKFSNTISDMNVFLLSTAFAFSFLEKNVFVNGNTDCALLFDGFSR